MIRGRARWIVLAVAAAVVVVLFLVFRPDDGDDVTAATTTESATTTNTDAATTSAPTTTAPRPKPKPVVLRVAVRNGKVVGGLKVHDLPYRKRVTLVVTSDVADHVHVHGYDIMRDVGPGRPARVRFFTRLSGRFEFELEESQLPLGSLEILPG